VAKWRRVASGERAALRHYAVSCDWDGSCDPSMLDPDGSRVDIGAIPFDAS
jgi:hypothetical protein